MDSEESEVEKTMSSLFPMFLKLEGKRCLVVGAGKVGEPKIGGLLDTGARIRVIALQASETVRGWAQAGKIRPNISHRLPIEDFAQAMRLLIDRKAIGRVALMMG